MGKQIKIQSLALALGLALMAIKVVAWWITSSNAILTDALESIVNIVAGAVGLYSLWLAAQPRDREHPYGHGKIEFVAAGLEGGMILFAGILIVCKAIFNLIEPQQLQSLDTGLWLTGITGLLNFGMGRYMERIGQHQKSMVLVSGGRHLQSDAWSSAGILVGLALLMMTGWQWMDGVTALLFGFVIVYHGWQTVRESVAGIMDEADLRLIGALAAHLEVNRRDTWIDVHNLRIIKYGATYHIDCHLTLPWYQNLQESHDEVKLFEETAAQFSTQPVELFIHSDPCEPHSCEVCQLSDCKVRQRDFQNRVNWTPKVLISHRMHSVS